MADPELRSGGVHQVDRETWGAAEGGGVRECAPHTLNKNNLVLVPRERGARAPDAPPLDPPLIDPIPLWSASPGRPKWYQIQSMGLFLVYHLRNLD